MTARRLNTFRTLLQAKQADLGQRIAALRERLAVDDSGDALDRVHSLTERESAVRNLGFEVRLLAGVREALREIDAGTFGRCAACDAEIPLRRLEAVPWSPYCIHCQEGAEVSHVPAREEYYAQAG